MKTLLCLFILTAGALAGQTYKKLKLTDGTVLKNAVVKEETPKGLKIAHDDGVGLIEFRLLPDAVRKPYNEIAKEKAREDAAAAMRAEKARTARANQDANKAAADEAAAAARGLDLKVTAVKSGGNFFRYMLSAQNLTGEKMAGVLSIRFSSAWKPEGVGSRELKLAVAANGFSSGFIDWHTGPPCRHGEAGLKKFVWTLKAAETRHSGESAIPDEIKESLSPDVKMQN